VAEYARDNDLATTMHWSLPDPSAAADNDRASYPEFHCLASELNRRIEFLLPALALHPEPRER
jgi:ArsR family transcriptional regulator, arsenate/arsenite/antimonite-responsive transcriptional repressor / arsenate reductase (thioredoxin)